MSPHTFCIPWRAHKANFYLVPAYAYAVSNWSAPSQHPFYHLDLGSLLTHIASDHQLPATLSVLCFGPRYNHTATGTQKQLNITFLSHLADATTVFKRASVGVGLL